MNKKKPFQLWEESVVPNEEGKTQVWVENWTWLKLLEPKHNGGRQNGDKESIKSSKINTVGSQFNK